MTGAHLVGTSRPLPPHAQVREDASEYVIELDVADFTERELTVETVGRSVTVRGDQPGGELLDEPPFRLHEHLEETFRVPDDADTAGITAVYRHGTLELRVPRTRLEPRPVEVTRAGAHVHPDAQGV